MSTKSNDYGRAFEYACIVKLKDRIEDKGRPAIIDENSVVAVRKAWDRLDQTERQTYISAADAFIDTLFEAEPLILEYDGGENDSVKLYVNRDSDAEHGDVRDIVIARETVRWNIGLSMKHNHFAAKHSRLSPTIDFGEKWYNIPCDESYWNVVNPIFVRLRHFKEYNVAWHDMQDKEDAVYKPIMDAFINEINRAYELDKSIPERLISYLLGVRDFYKVVAVDNKRLTEFQPFNLRGELNRNGRRTKAMRIIPRAVLPTEIISFRLKENREILRNYI